MKKILIILTIYLISANISFAEEKNCSGMKKLSKEYLACATKNIKEGANKKNKQIKKDSAKKTEQIKIGAKKIIDKVKSKIKINE